MFVWLSEIEGIVSIRSPPCRHGFFGTAAGEMRVPRINDLRTMDLNQGCEKGIKSTSADVLFCTYCYSRQNAYGKKRDIRAFQFS